MDKTELVQTLFEQIGEQRKLDRDYHQFLLKKNMKREAQFYEERINVVDPIRFELKEILEGRTTRKEDVFIQFTRD